MSMTGTAVRAAYVSSYPILALGELAQVVAAQPELNDQHFPPHS